MDNSDISLVKEETIERIKTEPRGDDDELYMSGRPRIKTEDDSNLPGYFNDTINYEPECSQKSDLQMKSPWDGFLPIKEQVKDESDSSDYEEKVMKTEMKFYDSSLGVMDSRPDHFIVDVKSQDEPDSPDYEDKIVKTEMKDYDSSPGVMESSPNHSNLDVKFQIMLEKDHSTLSSEINYSNLYVQESSDFNFEKECYQLNLGFNQRLSHKHENNDNFLLKRKFLNTSKNNTLQCNTSTTKTKCESENCNNQALKGELCVAHGGRRKCNTENCTKSALKGGLCVAHGGTRKCKTENCAKQALKGGLCVAHVGGIRCKTVNCTNKARLRGYCVAHGGVINVKLKIVLIQCVQEDIV